MDQPTTPDRDGAASDGTALDGAALDGAAPCGVGSSSGVAATLVRIEADLAELQGAALLVHSDGEAREAVAHVARLRAKLDAAYLRLLADLDDRRGAVPGAAPSRVASTFLVHGCAVAPARAAQDVRAAHAVTDTGAGTGGLSGLGQALAEGTVSLGHVDAAVRALRDIPKHLLEAVDETGATGLQRIDAFLTEHARVTSPDTLARIAKHLVATLDPDGSDSYDPAAVDRRRLDYATDVTGMLVGSFALDPVAGAHFRAVIEALVKADLPDRDHSVGRGAPGRDQPEQPLPDRRTAGQRRADALDQLCRDAMTGFAPDPAEPAASTTSAPTATSATSTTSAATASSAATATTAAHSTTAAPTTQVIVVATPDQIAEAMAGSSHGVDPEDADCAECETGDTGVAEETGDGGDAEETGNTGEIANTGPTKENGVTGGPPAVGLAVDLAAGPIDARSLALLLCSAVLVGVTLDGPAGPVLNHGRSRRLATAAQVRALIARDRGCIVPGCTQPPARCQAHHIIWWRHGGRTDIDNLALLCTRHHTAVHTGRWRLTVIERLPYVIAPQWTDPLQIPRRNTFPDAEHGAHVLGQQLGGRTRRGRSARLE